MWRRKYKITSEAVSVILRSEFLLLWINKISSFVSSKPTIQLDTSTWSSSESGSVVGSSLPSSSSTRSDGAYWFNIEKSEESVAVCKIKKILFQKNYGMR